MKKQTMPNEPDEMPATAPKPEINQPNDPQQQETPQEAPDNLPLDMPPAEMPSPEIKQL